MMEFYKPSTLQEALKLLNKYGENALVVNGGTDAVLDLTEGRVRPEAIVYIADLPELQSIGCEDGRVFLGGAVTYSRMEADPVLSGVRGLMESLRRLGSPTIRESGTAAGNIAKGATAADCSTMLTALRAEIVLAREGGQRRMALPDVFVDSFRTAIEPQELITRIEFPLPEENEGTGFVKYSRRRMQDIGKILVGARICVQGGVCTGGTVSLGAVNRTVVRSSDIEKRIAGKTLEEIREAVRAARPAEAVLRDSYFRHYKELAVSGAVCEALEAAWKDAVQEKEAVL